MSESTDAYLEAVRQKLGAEKVVKCSDGSAVIMGHTKEWNAETGRLERISPTGKAPAQ